MSYIQTVLGKINPDEIGVTDYHDHLITVGGGEVKADKDLALESVDNAIDAMKRFKKAGGSTIVDMNPIDCGRDIDKLIEVAKSCEVNIISCTGFQRSIYYDKSHWVNKYSVAEVAELIAQEVTEGIEVNSYMGPIIHRSSAKAGVIKCASHYNTIMPMEWKCYRAGVLAAKKTGASISSHTERGTMGLEVIEILKEEKFDLGRVTLGHVDRNPNLEYHIQMASQGITLGYDGPSRAKYYPDNVLIDLIKGMIKAGYGDRIMLGGDNGRASMWPQYVPGCYDNECYGHNYILKKFVPELLEAGVDKDDIRKILIDNPKRQFSII